MYKHNKAQQSKNRVHISCDILYKGIELIVMIMYDNRIYREWQ